MIIKLDPQQKFFVEDDEGNLILVDKIDISPEHIKNDYMFFKGKRFDVDYDYNKIEEGYDVDVEVSFKIEVVHEID